MQYSRREEAFRYEFAKPIRGEFLITNEYWASSVIQQVNVTGLMQGYVDGSFGPDQHITRAEMASIVVRWLQLEGEAASF